MVKALGVKSASEPAKINHVVHHFVQVELSPAVLSPMLPVLVEDLKEAWEYSASINPSSTSSMALYKVDKASAKFLFLHPVPSSMIVHSSAKSKGAKPSLPPDHNSCKVVSFAHKNYSVAAMLARIHTYLSYISGYVLSMSNKISDFSQDSIIAPLAEILALAN